MRADEEGSSVEKIKRFMAAILVLLLVAAAGCSCADEDEDEGVIAYTSVDAGSVLRVHVNASISSEVFFFLERGEQVFVEEIEGQWAKVSRGGDWGWCVTEYLSDRNPDDVDGDYVVSSNGRVRVRNKPDGDKIRYVYDGDRVCVEGVKERDGRLWAFVGDGFVMMDYLRKEDDT